MLSCRLRSQTSLKERSTHHHYTKMQTQSSCVEFQVPVFRNPESPGYTCCVLKPFLSLVAGNTVQEVQKAVEDCVCDFIALYKEEGHKVPAAPPAPSRRSLDKQDGFQQLLTISVLGIFECCHCCRLLFYASAVQSHSMMHHMAVSIAFGECLV